MGVTRSPGFESDGVIRLFDGKSKVSSGVEVDFAS
jgi:hypothetical protein